MTTMWRDDITEESVRNRARRGAKALDTALGPNWWQQIDEYTLAMDDASRCILGQLGKPEEDWSNPGYNLMLKRVTGRLRVTATFSALSEWASSHGFEAITSRGVCHSRDWTFQLLQKQWLREIAKRRKA